VTAASASGIHSSTDLLSQVNSVTIGSPPATQQMNLKQNLEPIGGANSVKLQAGGIETKLEKSKFKDKDETKLDTCDRKSIKIAMEAGGSPPGKEPIKKCHAQHKDLFGIADVSPVKTEITSKPRNSYSAICGKTLERTMSIESSPGALSNTCKEKIREQAGFARSSSQESTLAHSMKSECLDKECLKQNGLGEDQKSPSEDTDSTETCDEKPSESYGVVDVVADGPAHQDVCFEPQDSAPAFAMKVEGRGSLSQKSRRGQHSTSLNSDLEQIRGAHSGSQFFLQQPPIKNEPSEMFSNVYTEDVVDTPFAEITREPLLKKPRPDKVPSPTMTLIGTSVDL